MKHTAFYDIHKSLGAKIVDFAGFEMPVQYSGIIEEHLAVRNNVGVFDVSHMGEFQVRGKGALQFLQKVTVNDVSKLSEGRVQYSAMCYDDGGIVDDLLVYNAGDHYMLVVNASNIDKDFKWLETHCGGDVTLTNNSDEFSLLAIQGPKSQETLQKLTSVSLSSVEYYHFKRGTVAGIPMIISRTGYTGELGFEIYFESSVATGKKVWDAIFEAGKSFGIAPIGLGARDTLRLEMGFCLYGNDIDQTTNPLEAGLGWITKMNKGEFIGKGPMLKAKETGLQRRLTGFELPEKTIARHGFSIVSHGKSVGHVTSGTFSPSLKKSVAMGYVSTQYAEPGSLVAVSIRGKDVPAKVVRTPFLTK
ncbi:MAG TPA: glycine cleavage system aminomethyltransferase GcvT [Bacteroidota bacterium]